MLKAKTKKTRAKKCLHHDSHLSSHRLPETGQNAPPDTGRKWARRYTTSPGHWVERSEQIGGKIDGVKGWKSKGFFFKGLVGCHVG